MAWIIDFVCSAVITMFVTVFTVILALSCMYKVGKSVTKDRLQSPYDRMRRRSSIKNLKLLRSGVIRMILHDSRTGQRLYPRKIMQEAADRKMWMVAYDAGPYVLEVGDQTLRFGMMHADEFGQVLSHRWNPVIHTDSGPVPAPMMSASFERPTWVDFINHFNEPDHLQRVLEGMGQLYAKKYCRALYFEGSIDFAAQVESASRSWMWQELSLGPQRHNYNSVQAMWLHHVVAVGDLETLIAITELGVTALHVTLLAFERRLFESRVLGISSAEPQDTTWWRSLKRSALHWFVRSIVPPQSTSPALRHELQNGTFRSVLEMVFEAKLGGKAETQVFIDWLCLELHHPGQQISDQLWAVGQISNEIASLMCRSVGCVILARQYAEQTTLISVRLVGRVCGVLRYLQGARALSQGITNAAMTMLQSGREGTWLSSALANLGNKNLQYDSDRLSASFGVLCATNNLPCDPPSCARMVLTANRVNVFCLPRNEACGVGQIARKRVRFSVRGDKSGSKKWYRTGPCYLFTSMVVIEGEWEHVEISGMRMEDIYMLALGDSLRGASSWHDGWGEVRQYTLMHDAVVHMKVWMDCGYMIRMGEPSMHGSQRGKRINLDRRAFREWYAQLEDA